MPARTRTAGARRLQLVSLASAAVRLPPDRIEEIMEDYDPEKELDRDEFGAYWTKLGFPPESLDGYFSGIDVDGSGKVSFKEFLGGLAASSGQDSAKSAALIMKVYDVNNSGSLEKDEFVSATRSATKVLRAGIASALNSLADEVILMQEAEAEVEAAMTAELAGEEDSGGEIVDETPTREEIMAEMMAEVPEIKEPTQAEIDAMFARIDVNSDGRLAAEEVERLLATDDPVIGPIFQPNLAVKKMAGDIEEQWAQSMVDDCCVM